MSCGEKGNQMPEEDGVKQNRSSFCNKELVLGKADLKIETFKPMKWCRKNQRDRQSALNACLREVPTQDLHGVIIFWRRESEEL